MRWTKVLNKQHIDFMFKKHWLIQGKRVPINTGAEEFLKSKGIPVQDALEFVKEIPEPRECPTVIGQYEPPLPLDDRHPDYKRRPCRTLKNTTVLLDGIRQAQVLTKAIIFKSLPHKIEELAQLSAPKTLHDYVKKAILSANVFDCEQKKLPKIKDPSRPAYNFPRVLGITDRRRNQILTNKLMHIIERSSDLDVTQARYVVNDVEVRTLFNKEDELIQFEEVSHILVTSNKPVKYDTVEKDLPYVEIPDLYPVKHTVALPEEHFYSDKSFYPISQNVSKNFPHTTWLHYNSTEVANIYEEPVTPNQILGRSLIHAFTVTSAYAKQLYGEDIRDLPEPIFVNCIQTDGNNYHFGVFQLNTLNLDGTEGIKNMWYCKNDMKMYESSKYFSGMPSLDKYNPKVFSYINAFYNC